MRMIIDGYNLLRTMRQLRKQEPPGVLENERNWLLNWLADLLKQTRDPKPEVTLVFDGKNSPSARANPSSIQRGIHVVFATQGEADDWIELEVGQSSSPKSLAVVSEDKRIVQFARKKGCKTLSCFDLEDFLAQWAGEKVAPESEKPSSAGPEDLRMLEELMRSEKAKASFKKLSEL